MPFLKAAIQQSLVQSEKDVMSANDAVQRDMQRLENQQLEGPPAFDEKSLKSLQERIKGERAHADQLSDNLKAMEKVHYHGEHPPEVTRDDLTTYRSTRLEAVSAISEIQEQNRKYGTPAYDEKAYTKALSDFKSASAEMNVIDKMIVHGKFVDPSMTPEEAAGWKATAAKDYNERNPDAKLEVPEVKTVGDKEYAQIASDVGHRIGTVADIAGKEQQYREARDAGDTERASQLRESLTKERADLTKLEQNIVAEERAFTTTAYKGTEIKDDKALAEIRKSMTDDIAVKPGVDKLVADDRKLAGEQITQKDVASFTKSAQVYQAYKMLEAYDTQAASQGDRDAAVRLNHDMEMIDKLHKKEIGPFQERLQYGAGGRGVDFLDVKNYAKAVDSMEITATPDGRLHTKSDTGGATLPSDAVAQAQKTTSDYERGANAQQRNTGLNQELLAKVRAQMAERDAARGQTPDMSQSR